MDWAPNSESALDDSIDDQPPSLEERNSLVDWMVRMTGTVGGGMLWLGLRALSRGEPSLARPTGVTDRV